MYPGRKTFWGNFREEERGEGSSKGHWRNFVRSLESKGNFKRKMLGPVKLGGGRSRGKFFFTSVEGAGDMDTSKNL